MTDEELGKFVRTNYVKLDSFWDKDFWKYMSEHDMPAVVQALKAGMDAPSIEYVDRFLNLLQLSKIKNEILLKTSYAFTSKDAEFQQNHMKYARSVKNWPYREFGGPVQFIFANLYGLIDLPKDILKSIENRIIIDGGGYVGDTALLFYNLFPKSDIFAFEPVDKNFNLMHSIIKKYKADNRIEMIKAALSDNIGQTKLYFSNDQQMDPGASLQGPGNDYHKRIAVDVQMDTIDHFVSERNLELGLIKLDVEGAESAVLHGAEQSIRKFKPLIIAAIYHSPRDFFEIKPYLESLNLDYKFMIRRSELCLPMTDLVLIAY